jgi:hypothetical protein
MAGPTAAFALLDSHDSRSGPICLDGCGARARSNYRISLGSSGLCPGRQRSAHNACTARRRDAAELYHRRCKCLVYRWIYRKGKTLAMARVGERMCHCGRPASRKCLSPARRRSNKLRRVATGKSRCRSLCAIVATTRKIQTVRELEPPSYISTKQPAG